MDLACQALLALRATKELAGMQLVVGMEEPCCMEVTDSPTMELVHGIGVPS